MRSRIACLLLAILLLNGCESGGPPLANGDRMVLTQATEDVVTKAVGSRVEVEGVSGVHKEGDVVKTKHVTFLFEQARYENFPRDTVVRVTGTLRAYDPIYGYKFQIINAKITPVANAKSPSEVLLE